MTPDVQHLIDDGWAALRRADWLGAKHCFEQALLRYETPEAFDGLGVACWWLNEIPASHQHRTAAYHRFKSSGQNKKAAVIACWLAREQVFLHSNITAMYGWFARAQSLAQLLPRCPERAWCSLLRASMVENPQELEQTSTCAVEIAREFHDASLEAFALAFCGLAKVLQNRIPDGMHHLDEAMTMTTSGEVNDFMVISEIFCVMLSACEAAGDLIRSEQWCQKAWQFAEQHHCSFLSAYCRTTYGSILTTLGRWQEAEAALIEAVRAFGSGHQGLRFHAVIRLADLRVFQGRLEEAQVLLQGLQDQDSAAVPMARLHLAKREMDIAKAILEQSLQACPPYTLNHLPNLVLLVEILLSQEDAEGAHQIVTQLIELAQGTQSSQLVAQAELLRGRVYLHAGRPALARQCFVAALDQLKVFQQTLLAGQIRLHMARALQDTDPPGAVVWAKAALATFERINATHDVAQAVSLLRRLGVGAGSGPRLHKPLTQREFQITEFVAQGLTNREIAERLVISAKTVEHHISRILNKLDLRSRAEIAAVAASRKLTPQSLEDRG